MPNTTPAFIREFDALVADRNWFGLNDLPPTAEPGSDEEAYVLGLFTDLLSEDLESAQASNLRERYKEYKGLLRMMEAVYLLKVTLAKDLHDGK